MINSVWHLPSNNKVAWVEVRDDVAGAIHQQNGGSCEIEKSIMTTKQGQKNVMIYFPSLANYRYTK